MPLKVEVEALSFRQIENFVDAVFSKIRAVKNAIFATVFIHIIKYTLLGEFR